MIQDANASESGVQKRDIHIYIRIRDSNAIPLQNIDYIDSTYLASLLYSNCHEFGNTLFYSFHSKQGDKATSDESERQDSEYGGLREALKMYGAKKKDKTRQLMLHLIL